MIQLPLYSCRLNPKYFHMHTHNLWNIINNTQNHLPEWETNNNKYIAYSTKLKLKSCTYRLGVLISSQKNIKMNTESTRQHISRV